MINGRGRAPRGHRGAARRDNHGVNGHVRLDKPPLIAANPPVTPAVLHMMKKRWTESDWYVPLDWLFHFGMVVFLPLGMILAITVHNVIRMTRAGNPLLAYLAGAAGVIGIVLLFFARLPLYRQRKFFVLGSKQLPPRNQKLYRIAYGFLIPSMLTMLGILALVRS